MARLRKADGILKGKPGVISWMKKVRTASSGMLAEPGEKVYILRLYVAGQTERALPPLPTSKRSGEEHLAGRYKIEVIDLRENPQLAKGDQILAIPTLVRQLPPPLKKIIGDLSNTGKGISRPGSITANQID